MTKVSRSQHGGKEQKYGLVDFTPPVMTAIGIAKRLSAPKIVLQAPSAETAKSPVFVPQDSIIEYHNNFDLQVSAT